jgi:A/G-specific adenine glycosylase
MKVSIPSGADGPGTGGWPGPRGARLRRLREVLREWYLPRARPLRIRTTREPWAILVSEVMAQQTQIARVDEAWAEFMSCYPTPRALAAVSTAEVLRAWAGLGYNRRAVNLQRAAGTIEHEHGGRVPSDVAELEALPGVGPYTARAVAAIAFGQPVAAVDTNVRRVVTRVLGRELPPRAVQAEADAWVDTADPATWTHATMELGATVCVARRPRCEECPVVSLCASAGRVEAATPRVTAGSVPFERSTRWLRGRIIERLRALDDGAWQQLPSSIGEHDEAAVTAAVVALEREGMVERRPDGAVRLPSG